MKNVTRSDREFDILFFHDTYYSDYLRPVHREFFAGQGSVQRLSRSQKILLMFDQLSITHHQTIILDK